MSICRYCRGRILWAITEKGHRIPLDPSPVDNGNVMLDFRPGDAPIATVLGDPSRASGPLWLAHFATCKKLKHRKKKTAEPEPKTVQGTLTFGEGTRHEQ
jgi:hypothetical protein